MAVPTTCRLWRWRWRFGIPPLLLFLVNMQALPASCLHHTQDWTVCSSGTVDGSEILQPLKETCPLASDWSVWSQEPYCPEPEEHDASVPADCVFTLATFRGNQGISLITTPDLAASIAEYLDDSRVSPRLRRQLSNSGEHHQDDTAAYEIRDFPGRGKGLVAKHRIAKHDIVMAGFPVLVIRLDFINEDRYSLRQKRRMMERSVAQLPPAQKKSVMALARNTGGDVIMDVLRTNGFGVEIEGVQHLALFTDGSRVNHNCRPSSFWRYVNSDMAMEVVALRDIQAGEEIAHSYAPLGYTYEERKAVLQSWGFRCTCALCSAKPADRDLSDARRTRLLEVHQTLGQASGLGGQRVDQLVLQAMKLIEEEELHPQLVEYYGQFARAYLMVDNLRKARQYVSEADRMWQLYGGEEHENIDGMKRLWQALEEAERDAEED